MIAATSACILQLGMYAPRRTDILFSDLPLAHNVERCCELAVFMAGGAVGFFSGNIKFADADMKTLRPTILPAVPRFLNRIYDLCVSAVNKVIECWPFIEHRKLCVSFQNNMVRQIFNYALTKKSDELHKGIVRKSSIWDLLVLRFVRSKLGGNVRLVISGSVPLKSNVVTFLRSSLGCVVVEGYGQTECVAPATLTVQGDPDPDNVGPPLPCNNIKLVDIPDMDYWAYKGQGEVCVKGRHRQIIFDHLKPYNCHNSLIVVQIEAVQSMTTCQEVEHCK